MATTPRHIEARLERALADVQRLARERGLLTAFSIELYLVRVAVDDALASRDRGNAHLADGEVRALELRLRRTPPKARGPREGHGAPVLGRGGRGSL